jgi:calcium-translocating P-type ATPase
MLNALVLAIIIVVAAIPEGLPMMIAIVLSLNMRKLLVEKVLVRRLLGIETAGSMNILFSDKTGTITKGKLEPILFLEGSGTRHNSFQEIPDTLKLLLGLSIIENTSSYVSPDGEIVGGNISERALITFMPQDEISKIQEMEVKQEKAILFNSARKFSASQIITDPIRGIASNKATLIKGAPEVLFNITDQVYDAEGNKLTFDHKKALLEQMDGLADQGIRLIALAISSEVFGEDEMLPSKATLVGVVGISDEVREESKWAIEEVKRAGIQVVMITGDRKGTAASIAKDVGLLTEETDRVLVSSELQEHSDEELQSIVHDIRVIARALPTDKSRLVRLSKSLGKVVGMTGDGVNDSVALKQADIGVGMGSGSEVSKEASDIVILDDNFHSISNAIRYGRTIFKSIRKFIIFQLTVNVAAVSTAFIGPLIGIDFPLTIIQILWINIIMDTLAAIAFGGEPALVRYMDEPPVDREESILTKYMISSILTSGIFITAFGLFFLSYPPLGELFIRDGVPSYPVLQTAFFSIFIFMIMFNGFSVRTDRINLLDHLIENKSFITIMGLIFGLQILFTYIGGDILRTTPLLFEEWIIVLAFSLLIIPVDIIRKLVIRMMNKRKGSN